MLHIPTYILLALLYGIVFGCTNSAKTNKESYSINGTPSVLIPCIDTLLVENSGIIVWDNLFWTINDSGGKNEIYGFDRSFGKIRRIVTIANAVNIDWEDIAQDEKYIYIAETGNNLGVRTDLQILKIEKKKISRQPFSTVEAEKICISYADQSSFLPLVGKHRFDCEALFEYRGNLYVFTKDWVKFNTKVYQFPSSPGKYKISPIDSFDVQGLITGADIMNDGRFALIGYRNFHSFIWTFEKSESHFFGNPHLIDLGMLVNAQTEGICFGAKQEIYFSCEKTENYLPQIWQILPKQSAK